jgi:hypothetical protein
VLSTKRVKSASVTDAGPLGSLGPRPKTVRGAHRRSNLNRANPADALLNLCRLAPEVVEHFVDVPPKRGDGLTRFASRTLQPCRQSVEHVFEVRVRAGQLRRLS